MLPTIAVKTLLGNKFSNPSYIISKTVMRVVSYGHHMQQSMR